ncbi:MAG: peptide chain release factor N(5)-glutamine methyltransferase [Caldimonas sp.]
MTNVAAALADARARGVASLDAQLLLARLLATTRTRLIVHDERMLAPAEWARWSGWLERRLAGEPLAYLLGEKEFCGLLLEVDRGVLVPRPETELLVEWACESLDALVPERSTVAERKPLRVVDLGTGSGAIALALKRAHPAIEVTATDVSASALAVARRNADRLGLAIEFVEASWWQGLEGRRFDIAVANPPYVAADDPHLGALRYEPTLALTPGGDGLGALRAIASGAALALAPRGWLLVEHGFDQAAAVREMLGAAGLTGVETRRDLAGLERATGGRRAPD